MLQMRGSRKATDRECCRKALHEEGKQRRDNLKEFLIISGIGLIFGLVALIISFGRYMYQRGRLDGFNESLRIMAEVRGIRYEDITQDGTERNI